MSILRNPYLLAAASFTVTASAIAITHRPAVEPAGPAAAPLIASAAMTKHPHG